MKKEEESDGNLFHVRPGVSLSSLTTAIEVPKVRDI